MKNILDVFRFHTVGIPQAVVNEVLQTNQESQKYGLVLTDAEARGLVETRNQVISSHGRVELGIEPVKKIIRTFCNSPYIYPSEYTSTMGELIEIFYYMKNETGDRIGDNELIGIMYEYFNNSCRGSLELLKDREMALFVRQFRCDLQCNREGDGI